jgi:hypothetical protein
VALPNGYCCICGDFGPLTFEHVPPRSAFNKRPVILVEMEKVYKAGLDAERKGNQQQRGAGAYTLCKRCNSKTGEWYGERFAEWCQGGLEILQATGGGDYLIDMYDFYPLSVLKQSMSMFCSVNGPGLAQTVTELVPFIMHPERRLLDPRLRVFAYFNPIGHPRHRPKGTMLDLFTARQSKFSEIAFFPFGYVLVMDTESWDDRYFEITHFSAFEHEEKRPVWMRLPVLETHLPYQGDYRFIAQIRRVSGDLVKRASQAEPKPGSAACNPGSGRCQAGEGCARTAGARRLQTVPHVQWPNPSGSFAVHPRVGAAVPVRRALFDRTDRVSAWAG